MTNLNQTNGRASKTIIRSGGALIVAALLSPLSVSAAESPILTKSKEIGAGEFRGGLHYVCLDAKGNVFGGGGNKVVLFDPDGARKLAWENLPHSVTAVAVDDKGVIYAGGKDGESCKITRLEIKDNTPVTGKTMALAAEVNNVNSIKTAKDLLLVGDSKGRCIHKLAAADGKSQGVIGMGKGGKPTGLVSTCCGILDFDVDSKGQLVIANLGQHRVTICNDKGSNAKSWGQAGKKPEDFCGCCNPVSVAVAPDGSIVTAEKTIPRLKLYSANGKKLLGITETEDFDKGCANLIVTVDANKNIYAVDGKSNVIKVFSAPAAKK